MSGRYNGVLAAPIISCVMDESSGCPAEPLELHQREDGLPLPVPDLGGSGI